MCLGVQVSTQHGAWILVDTVSSVPGRRHLRSVVRDDQNHGRDLHLIHVFGPT